MYYLNITRMLPYCITILIILISNKRLSVDVFVLFIQNLKYMIKTAENHYVTQIT